MVDIHSERVEAIRRLMSANAWDAVVISGSDPHASEYPAPRWQQVKWISGFTGEAGDLVITHDHAGLWTDSRYFIQAIDELAGSGIELHKTRVQDAVSIPDWLAGQGIDTVAVDGKCQSVAAVRAIADALAGIHSESEYNIVDVPDMLDRIWDDRPWVPETPVTTLDEQDAGESRLHKIVWLRKFLMEKGYDAILLTSLDEIAWLLNVRGNDIAYNPLVISYLLVTLDDVFWYVKKGNSAIRDVETSDSFNELRADGVSILGYDDIGISLSEMDPDTRVSADAGTLNYSLYKLLRCSFGEDNVVLGKSPVTLRKAIKNAVETANLREAFVEDGIAVEKFLYWLETKVKSSSEADLPDEWEASEKLTSLRREIPGYRGDSFGNISAYGANAALPHYCTPAEGSAVIRPCGLYLSDSGGQYIFGTTDITRTVPLGDCSDFEKEDYTLVLKGMIDLAMAVFPRGTAGCHIDVLARNPLWRCKRNFGHGTGHGVGFYLCVHEGPQDIRQNFNSQPLLPGMVISDEPGIYREGRFGIRHENILLCREAGVNDFGEWLCFETLTCCHLDTSIIVRDLLSPDEISWLNAYNASVYTRLADRLPEEISLWLKEKTLPI